MATTHQTERSPLRKTVRFVRRWLTVATFFAATFFAMAIIFAALGENAIDEWGAWLVIGWLAVAYLGGHWLWHR